MSHSTNDKLYEKVGRITTEEFKKKYPQLCEALLYEVKDVQFLRDGMVIMKLKLTEIDEPIDLIQIENFITNLFGISIAVILRDYVSSCD